MSDNSSLGKISGLISNDDFYQDDYKAIFNAISDLAKEQSAFDVITLCERMSGNSVLQSCLKFLSAVNATPANIVSYADIVKNYSLRRKTIEISKRAIELSSIDNATAKDVLTELISDCGGLLAGFETETGGIVHIKKVLASAVENIEAMFESDGKQTGLIETGLLDFDKRFGGVQKGDLTVIAARPGSGKTTLAQNIVENFAIKKENLEKPVIFFTTEMPPEKLVMRMICSLGRLDYSKVSTGKIESAEEWARVTSAVNLLASSSIYIDGTNNLTTVAYQSKIEQFVRDIGKPEMIVVDFIQRMDVPEMRGNRTGMIREITRVLTLSAKDLDISVIALAQLNRNLESRPNKRPMMSDLSESGAIEENAGLIVFIYRDELYNEDSPDKGVAEIIAGKVRYGEIGTVRLVSNLAQSRFENHASEHYSESDYN
jgi:replicative DNA helicase